MAALSYVFTDEITSAEEGSVKAGINAHTKETGALPFDLEANFLCYEDGEIIGGITSQIIGSRLHVKLLWVDENYRGQGIATNLMQQLENVALEHKCTTAFVNTLSYQAPEFYLKMGYAEVARISGYHDHHDRIFYRKELI